MRKLLAIGFALIILSAVCFAADKPIVLLFPVNGTPSSIATEATQAVKRYLRETGKIDVVDFDTESALVQRALVEHRVTTEDVTGVKTPDTRLHMGKLLETDYVACGDISRTGDKILTSVWFAN